MLLYFVIAVVVALILAAYLGLFTRAVDVQSTRSSPTTSAAAPQAAEPNVYTLRPSLFTPAERSFLGVLDSLELPGLRAMGKVRLGDILQPVKGLDRSRRQTLTNKVNMKHVDILRVNSSDLRPVVGIELDDSSHDAPERATRDSFVDEAFASAKLPLLRIPAQHAYSPADLRQAIETALRARS